MATSKNARQRQREERRQRREIMELGKILKEEAISRNHSGIKDQTIWDVYEELVKGIK
ncbi:hypothetical protein [Desulfosporosinus sp.]|uniref:hypothetical protein n=1 Tax=Desulfosporosinus sp. TaxID=157907 RepID=UPI002619F802|nr:hypothetical protein [Desulfosporosinus sp.]